MSSPVFTMAVMAAWPTTAARPESIRAAPTPPARAVTRRGGGFNAAAPYGASEPG